MIFDAASKTKGSAGPSGMDAEPYRRILCSKNFKAEGNVLRWKGELEALSEIARSQPHADYTAFTKAYKSKFTYFLRTIESFEDYVDPIQEAIDDLLLSTLFGQTDPLPSDLRQLVTLTPAQGRLGVPDLRFEAPQQFLLRPRQ